MTSLSLYSGSPKSVTILFRGFQKKVTLFGEVTLFGPFFQESVTFVPGSFLE